jgi:hypothetical protein
MTKQSHYKHLCKCRTCKVIFVFTSRCFVAAPNGGRPLRLDSRGTSFSLPTAAAVNWQNQVRVELYYQRQSVGWALPVSGPRPHCFAVRPLRASWCGAPSLTMLAFASAIVVFYCLRFETRNLEDEARVYASPGTGWHRALGSLFVASHDSQSPGTDRTETFLPLLLVSLLCRGRR